MADCQVSRSSPHRTGESSMIAQQIRTTIAGIVLAVAVVITGVLTWNATATSYKHDIAKLEKAHADEVVQYERDIGAIKSKAQEDTAVAISRMKAAQDALAELDKQKTQELADAQAANDALKRDVADGSRRVRILQTNLTTRCDTSQHATSGDPSARSLGDGTAVELTREAGSLVLDLRQDIIRDQAKLIYLQRYVVDVVKQCKRL